MLLICEYLCHLWEDIFRWTVLCVPRVLWEDILRWTVLCVPRVLWENILRSKVLWEVAQKL